MTQDELKQAVAAAAIDYIRPKVTKNTILGIGTGSTSNFFIELLKEFKGKFVGAVASSEASASRLSKLGIDVLDLNNVSEIDIYIDGADEINHNLEMIKGGGAALTREKIVAACANEFVCIADASKRKHIMGEFPLPVEVIPMAREYVIRQLQQLGGNPVHRQGVVTDNQCIIVDVHNLRIDDAKRLEAHINGITGVIANGLFAIAPANVLFLGEETGVKQYVL